MVVFGSFRLRAVPFVAAGAYILVFFPLNNIAFGFARYKCTLLLVLLWELKGDFVGPTEPVSLCLYTYLVVNVARTNAGFEWYEMHQEIMIVASEAVLPLGVRSPLRRKPFRFGGGVPLSFEQQYVLRQKRKATPEAVGGRGGGQALLVCSTYLPKRSMCRH